MDWILTIKVSNMAFVSYLKKMSFYLMNGLDPFFSPLCHILRNNFILFGEWSGSSF